MQTYAPGARVEIRNEEWMIRRVEAAGHARALHVLGLSDLVRNQEAIFLDDLDAPRLLAPEDTDLVLDDSPGHRQARLYLEALLRRSPPTDHRLVIGHRAATTPTPYQWEPAAQALAQPRPRILMADGVGLGKTIEVGVLLSELIQRGRGQRILVVALKSILKQFQEELWARFTLPLVRLDSVGIQRVQARIPSNQNPFHVFDKVIISIDTLKKDQRYQRYLMDCHWDAVVIDECQNVAERGPKRSQRARLARLLATNTDALILTSATPHDGKAPSFASLIRLLEPTAIANDEAYGKDEVGDLFIRRFQKDVRGSTRFHERDVGTLRPRCTPQEEACLQALADARFRTVGRSRNTDALFRVLLRKAWLSSPVACAESLAERQKTLLARKAQDDDVAHDLALLKRLEKQVRAVPAAEQSKLQRLFTHLESLGWRPGHAGERVVLFSERIATLTWLHDQLVKRFSLTKTTTERMGEVALFHGGLPDTEQYRRVQDFSNRKGALRLLLGSDAASEGLNLHHACHHMVHFDVPWSLITLEQRNGRIDRFGQEHAPVIRYLVSEPEDGKLKGDQDILDRLIDKEREASKNLGDVAWLLKLHDAEAEERHLLEGVAQGRSATDLIPDVPDDDLDWLQDLLAGSDPPPTELAEPFRLFEDLDFAREAFTWLGMSGSTGDVDLLEQPPGFRLRPPPDLARRYELLPPELLRGRVTEFKLTTDRQVVMDDYARARDTETGWPEWELFWEQHPVADWLVDRVLAAFRRHEAPVLKLPRLDADAVFVLQGTLSNQRSQPVLVRWVAARLKDGSVTLESLQDFARRSGLDQPLSNTGRPIDTAPLLAARGLVVRAFEDHLRQHRMDYERDAATRIRPALRKLRGWRAEMKDRLARVQEEMLVSRSARSRDIEQRRAEVDRIYQAREDWIQQTVRCVPQPWIRVAAVLVEA